MSLKLSLFDLIGFIDVEHVESDWLVMFLQSHSCGVEVCLGLQWFSFGCNWRDRLVELRRWHVLGVLASC